MKNLESGSIEDMLKEFPNTVKIQFLLQDLCEKNYLEKTGKIKVGTGYFQGIVDCLWALQILGVLKYDKVTEYMELFEVEISKRGKI